MKPVGAGRAARLGGVGDGGDVGEDPPPLTAEGERVWVAPVRKTDLAPYARAVQRSRDRLARWNPVDPGDLERHLRFQSSGHRTFIVHAAVPETDHDLVARINVTGVVRGRAWSGQVGYDAYDPYAGRGLCAEGLRLVVGVAFAPEPRGMGLHRLEAAVQPGNERSAGLLRSLGFRRRGAWPDYLWLPDETGESRWRDHVLYGVTAAQWPAAPYELDPPSRPVVLLPVGAAACAARVAAELGVPLLDAATLQALAGADPAGVAVVRLLADCPGAVLVVPATWPAREVLRTAGYDPAAALDVRQGSVPGLADPAVACTLALQARTAVCARPT